MKNMKAVEVLVRKEESATDLPLPSYQTDGSSGVDLFAAVLEDTVVKPLQIKLISTGISLSIPKGYEAQIRPRSGLSLKHGIASRQLVVSQYR